MLIKRWVGPGIALVAGWLGWLTLAQAKPPEIFPLSAIKQGQKGYGLTTMSGTVPERFTFEVVGVAKNFVPGLDIILVKSDDPKLAVSGFWQGMSGSPLYIDEKVACAFSYGFRFNKVALGGCTPIETMISEGFRQKRGRASGAGTHASMEEWKTVVPAGRIDLLMTRPTRSTGSASDPVHMRSLNLAKSSLPVPTGENGFVQAAVPLAMAGVSPKAFAQYKSILDGFPLVPMQAGGTGSKTGGPTQFTPGGSIAVTMVRGDMSMAGTGTVSYVDEKGGVLAFGHPMFQLGEIYAPVSTAEVHAVVPSAQNAFVLASPMRELGSLVQDRQSCIAADTKIHTPMVPMHIQIDTDSPGQEKVQFNVELLQSRFFMASLANMAAANAISLYVPDRDYVTGLLRSKVWVKGMEPLEFVDYLSSTGGADGMVEDVRGLRVLGPILNNPFSPAEITRIDMNFEFFFDTNFGEIRTLRLPSQELKPGANAYVDVELTRFDGSVLLDRVPFFVPAKLAGSMVQLEVTAGDSTTLDAPPPDSLPDLIQAFRKLLPGNVYAVTLYSAQEGAALGGKIVRDLPSSALDKLYASSGTLPVSAYRVIARSTSPTKRVINGRKTISIRVSNEN